MNKINEKKGIQMKLQIVIVSGILFLVSLANAQEKPTLKNQKEKMSYIIGMDIGTNLKRQSIDIEPNIVVRGIKDALAGGKPLLTDQEIQETMAIFQKDMMAKQQEVAKKNKKEGEAFLNENKKKEGVKTLPSGLQYKVIKEGTGKKPKLNDAVTVNYRGTLIDGTEFDNSYKRGQPASMQVSGVIPGWTEALQLMGEGAKWQLFIPSNLAYGERGAGAMIGPNATLIFEVELISIQEKKQEIKQENKQEKK
jgi:FKBP-type peptidyl-prolyl cis-trans isomerase FklB